MKGACSMCLNQESPWSFCALPAGVCLEESKVWCLLPLQRNSILQVPREHNIPWLSHCSFFWLRFCNCCREQVANYIDRRDGSAVPKADPEDKCHAIWLFDAVGACRRVGRIERISTCLWKEPVSRISTWLMVHRLEWRRCLRLGSLPTSIAKSAWARAAWKHVQCTLTWSDLIWPSSQVMIGDSLDGVLIPIPQYPLYSVWVLNRFCCCFALLVCALVMLQMRQQLPGWVVHTLAMSWWKTTHLVKADKATSPLQEWLHGLHFVFLTGWAVDVDVIEKKIQESDCTCKCGSVSTTVAATGALLWLQDYIASGGRVRGIAMLWVTTSTLEIIGAIVVLFPVGNLSMHIEAVINPGNPTGTVLTRDVIEAVVRRVSTSFHHCI